MRYSPTERPRLPLLKAARIVIVIPILINVTLVVLAGYVAVTALHSKYPKTVSTGVFFLASVTLTRLIWLTINGFIQARTASVMIAEKPTGVSLEGKSGGKSIENDRRRWYRLWLWWNRLGTLLLVLQVVAACLIFRNNNNIQQGSDKTRLRILLIILPVATLAVVSLGWFTGSELLSWRSLYTRKSAWRAHYSEAFRCCIREALCCMGRYRYLAKERSEEVYSVASLLGHLVTYRAEGCSHLEVLAGISMLRGYKQAADISEKQEPAPGDLREASILHSYAVAAYTGPLLELGRYPYCWPLVWLYSQGFWSFWKRSRRPVLEGDNLWRGHAAAFLRHARLPAKYLKQGRVLQTKREPAYFVVVLRELETVVVAVRGTETLEDLLTDGLSKETPLSESDLLGLLKEPHVSDNVKEPDHYAHSGIIEAARELSLQLDNLAEDNDDAMAASDVASIEGHNENELPKGRDRRGLLSKLFSQPVAEGGCQGYKLRLVGHSLGGSICALTGLRLYSRYPNLRVYAFGAVPCVDDVIAEACQKFIISVVYHDEFSSRLSVASMMRLRVNAEKALSEDTRSARAKTMQVDRQGEHLPVSSTNKSCTSCGRLSGTSSSDRHSIVGVAHRTELPSSPERKKYSELRKTQRLPYMFKGGVFLCAHACFCVFKMSQHHKATAINSEVQRCVHTLSTQQSSRITSKSQWQCMGNGNHERESMTRLVPPRVPALFSLTDPNGVIESKGDINSNLAGTEDGQFFVVDLEMQSYDKSCSDVPNDESSGHDVLRRRESDLWPNGMPMRMSSGFVDNSDEEAGEDLRERYPVEMYLPGQVIHILRQEKPAVSWRSSFWNAWQAESEQDYKAVVLDRKEFRDLVISPSMFIDHMPWKCQHALNLIVRTLPT